MYTYYMSALLQVGNVIIIIIPPESKHKVNRVVETTTLIVYCLIGLRFGVRLATVFVWYESCVRLWWKCIVISTYLQEYMFRI